MPENLSALPLGATSDDREAPGPVFVTVNASLSHLPHPPLMFADRYLTILYKPTKTLELIYSCIRRMGLGLGTALSASLIRAERWASQATF